MDDARRTAEMAARISYGRLLSILAARSRDIAGAEDALADAFVSALESWPRLGIPQSPEAWLLTSARNRLKNSQRHQAVAVSASDQIKREVVDSLRKLDDGYPDERLKLLFVCAHPALNEGVRPALMLQTVLGFDAVRIASAFLTAPATIGQRLVRAKAKIRDAGIRFEVPEPAVMPDRILDVLNAIYAAFGTAWDAVPGAASRTTDMSQEAIYLCRLLASLLPNEPEAKGLLALMLHCEARRKARRDEGGRFVPLSLQDARLWSRDMIIEAENLIGDAARFGRFGRFLCEAAIQSVHAQRPITGHTNYTALKTLYAMLAAYAPTVGVLVAQAGMLVEAGEPENALRQLETLPSDHTKSYQPYWVVRSTAFAKLGQRDEEAEARKVAIGLTEDSALRDYLDSRP